MVSPLEILSKIKTLIENPELSIENDKVTSILEQTFQKISSLSNKKYINIKKITDINWPIYEYKNGYGFYIKNLDDINIKTVLNFFTTSNKFQSFLVRMDITGTERIKMIEKDSNKILESLKRKYENKDIFIYVNTSGKMDF